MNEVICNNNDCLHSTSLPVHWERVVIGYEFDLNKKEFTGNNEDGAEPQIDIEFACPRCGTAYHPIVQNKLNRIMSS